MKYFSSGPLIFMTASLLFFSYAANRYSETAQTPWIPIGIGIGVLIAGVIYGYWQYQRNKDLMQ